MLIVSEQNLKSTNLLNMKTVDAMTAVPAVFVRNCSVRTISGAFETAVGEEWGERHSTGGSGDTREEEEEEEEVEEVEEGKEESFKSIGWCNH